MTLDKTDVQKFFKRLRLNKKNHEKIKYYACGEYGGQSKRPHYHLIIFNADGDTIPEAWTLDAIPIGTIHIGKLSAASASYTLKYMSKPSQIPQHKNDDRKKEFSLMSKGMGANYLTENQKKWHKNDIMNRMYVPLKDGKKIAMPRYYKNKIYTQWQRQQISNHIKKEAENEALITPIAKALLDMEKESKLQAEKGRKSQNDQRNNPVL